MSSFHIDNQKRVLVIAPFFSIGGQTSRPHFVASVLAEFMSVDVVTSDGDHGELSRRQE